MLRFLVLAAVAAILVLKFLLLLLFVMGFTVGHRYVSCENMYLLALEITPVLQNIEGNVC
jgi:hypothetical protein